MPNAPKDPKKQKWRLPLIVIFVAPFVIYVSMAIFLLERLRSNKRNDDYVGNKIRIANSRIDLVPNLLKTGVEHQGEQIRHAIDTLTSSHFLSAGLRETQKRDQVVGEHISEFIMNFLHVSKNDSVAKSKKVRKKPISVQEVMDYLTNWIQLLHKTNFAVRNATAYEEIWQSYHDLTAKTLYPWDLDYRKRMPIPRDDGSFFLSIASYRDENCLKTITQAFERADNPEKLVVGLVQQNCHKDCKSGFLEGGRVVSVDPDEDCYERFCESPIGDLPCKEGRVRLLDINEPDALGPYAARFLASKLWYGEQWYMQIDSHTTFASHWDTASIEMLRKAPSKKPIISHYPAGPKSDVDSLSHLPATRICGPAFADNDIESQIIRFEGSWDWDKKQLGVPRFAPFVAAGFLVTHSSFLNEVPFDPFLPWIFTGEEILMSARLWTAGFDIFSPTRFLVGHRYGREHEPHFWDSVDRTFKTTGLRALQNIPLDRIKYQLGYPEASRDILERKSVLTAVEQYSMGTVRKLHDYLLMVGLNMTTKEVHETRWCETGQPPKGMEHYAYLYET